MNKITILVIDSDFKHLNNCSILLSKLGYKVIAAQNNEAGLNIYRKQQNHIDIILLNFQICGKSYFTAIPAFIAINPQVKIIGMSDSINIKELPLYFREKILDILPKPLSEKVLNKLIIHNL